MHQITSNGKSGRLFLLHGNDKKNKSDFRKKLIQDLLIQESFEAYSFEINPENNFSLVTEALAQVGNIPLFASKRLFVLKIQLEAEKRKGGKNDNPDGKDFFSRERCRTTSGKLAGEVFPSIGSLDGDTIIIFDFYFELDPKNDFLKMAKSDNRFIQIKEFKEFSTRKNESKDVFRFVDTIIEGKIKDSLYLMEKIAQEEKNQGSDEVSVALSLLGLLAFKTNRLLALKNIDNPQEAQRKLGISPYFFQPEKNQSNRFSQASLFKLFKKIVMAQQKAKSGLYSPLLLVTTILFAFSTERQKPQSV